jgi:ribosomal protein L40E
MDGNKGSGSTGGGGVGKGGGPDEVVSLLELAEDHCPKCGAVMAPDAVVCVKCGYDLRANEARQSFVGKPVEVPSLLEDKKPDAPDMGPFVRPPASKWENERVLAAAGGVLALGAAVAAAVNFPASSTAVTIGAAVLALYSVALHTGTGLAAVGVAAAITERPYGSIRIAAARVLVAFGAFELVKNLRLEFTGGPVLIVLAACLVYFLLIWGLFRRTARETGIVCITHFFIWFLLMLAEQLYAWVQAGVVAGKVAGGGSA